MNFWTGLHFFCFLVYAAGFFYIIIKNPYSIASWVLSLLFFCFGLWSICNAVLYNTTTPHDTAEIVIKIQSIAWASFITYYFLFILYLSDSKKLLEQPLPYVILILVPLLFIYQAYQGQMLDCCQPVSYGLTARWKNTPWTLTYFSYYTIIFLAEPIYSSGSGTTPV